ncbi:hypothetical protein PENSPDRAFT_672659, partial [Peniophora sp. CONT]
MDHEAKHVGAAIHRVPLELWARILAYAYCPEHNSTSQAGERLLPTDWHVQRWHRQTIYQTGSFATSACVARAHPAERALSRQTPCCSIYCGLALESPNQYIPSIVSLSQVNKRLRCMAFGLDASWAANALSIPARLADALHFSGGHLPLQLATPFGICEHILLLLGPHLHRAVTLKTALPSHCREDARNSAALYLADCLAGADGLTALELFFDAALPSEQVHCTMVRLDCLQSVRLQNSPVLFWSAGLTELDLATEIPEWTWKPSELLPVLAQCPKLQYLTLQLVLIQDDEYIWMTDAGDRGDRVILSDLRSLSCDCRDYELVTLLYAMCVPATTNVHYGQYGVTGGDTTDVGIESMAQMGVTLLAYARPHLGKETMDLLLNDTDNDDHDGIHDIATAHMDKDHSETNDTLSSENAVPTRHDDELSSTSVPFLIQAIPEDPICESFWASAAVAGLDVQIAAEDRLRSSRRPDSVTLVQGSDTHD